MSSLLRSRKLITIEVAVFLVLIAVSIIVFYGLVGGGIEIYSAIFHVIRASTTPGFQYINIQSLSAAPRIFMILIMLIGGATFSTAGGIKVGRLILDS